MAEPEDMVVPLLREMRAEMRARFDGMDARFDAVGVRLASMDAALVTFRHALGADSLMSKFVVGEFEERLEALERKMRELETSK